MLGKLLLKSVGKAALKTSAKIAANVALNVAAEVEDNLEIKRKERVKASSHKSITDIFKKIFGSTNNKSKQQKNKVVKKIIDDTIIELSGNDGFLISLVKDNDMFEEDVYLYYNILDIIDQPDFEANKLHCLQL